MPCIVTSQQVEFFTILNHNIYIHKHPIYIRTIVHGVITMDESIRDTYLELEKDSLNRSAKGEKAEKLRAFVRDVAKEVKKPKLSLAALYNLAKKTFPNEKIDRSYFSSVVEKTWETSRDSANGTVWVEITKEKKPEAPPAKA